MRLDASFPQTLREFIERELNCKNPFATEIKSLNEPFTLEDVRYRSNIDFLPLELDLDLKLMISEAMGVFPHAVFHRNSETHRGWKSLCLHGLAAQKTQSWKHYGYADQNQAPYGWTEMCALAPYTHQWLQKWIPYKKYYRVRWMYLEPGGYIMPHGDYHPSTASQPPGLSAINLAITHPSGCLFAMEGKGILPFKPGKALYLNVARKHAVVNTSKAVRIHLIIHGVPEPDPFLKLIRKSLGLGA